MTLKGNSHKKMLLNNWVWFVGIYLVGILSIGAAGFLLRRFWRVVFTFNG